MPTDITVNQLIINEMTKEKYNELVLSGYIFSDNEIYLIEDDDTGADIRFDNTDTDLEATNVSDAIKELAIKHTELTGNVVTLPGGATISLSEEFGDAPYVIEISSEGGSSTVVSPSTIKYDNSTSGLTATTMQGAIDELAILVTSLINK